MRRRSPEIALRGIMVDGLLQHARRIFGVRLAIGFDRFCQRIGGVVGLVEVFGLDRGGALEGEAGFLA